MDKQSQAPGRPAWLFMAVIPAFALGAAVTFAALWLGPVAVRNEVIAEYEADVARLARELDSIKRISAAAPAAADIK